MVQQQERHGHQSGSLLFDDDSLVADVGRPLRHGLRSSRGSDQALAGLPISRPTRDKRLRPSRSQGHERPGSVHHGVCDGGTSDFRPPRSSDGPQPRQASLHAGISASDPRDRTASDPRGRASRQANDDTVTCSVTLSDC